MTRKELDLLSELLLKLQEERLQEYRDEGYDVDSMDEEEIMELDDGDNLIQGIDLIYCVVQNIKPVQEERNMTREQDKHYKVRTTYIDYYITREDIDLPVQEHLIVELYSK